MRRLPALGLVGILAVVGVACDDDEGGDDAQTFCDLAYETPSDPSDEQLEELADAAPDEISDQVNALVDFAIDEGVDTEPPDDLQDESNAINEWFDDNCEDEEPG